MRSRMTVLMLGALMVLSFAACSKKDQSQNQNQPATSSTDTSTAASSQPAAQPAAPTSSATNQQMAAPAAPAQQEAAAPPPPPPPLVVPTGTRLVIRMGNTVSSKNANPGDPFRGTLTDAVVVKGDVAIPRGAMVSGTVVQAKSPGKFKGEGVLSLRVTSITVSGVPYHVSTSAYTQVVKGKGKRTAAMAGGGAGAGALIGGLAGGGKGAAIGALVGGGAGTAGAAYTGNKELVVPAESAVTFRLTAPVKVTR